VRCLLYDQYDKIFGSPWPVIPSALVIAAVNVFLFAFERPWAASDGLRNWGRWFVAIIRTDSGSVAAAALLRIVFEFGLTLWGRWHHGKFLFARI
jgi:hypothetical protein